MWADAGRRLAGVAGGRAVAGCVVLVSGAGGELSKLEFHDERYRTMARAELADAIVKVVEQLHGK